jgi:hypothetical protein
LVDAVAPRSVVFVVVGYLDDHSGKSQDKLLAKAKHLAQPRL